MNNGQYRNEEDLAYQAEGVEELAFAKASADEIKSNEHGLGEIDSEFNQGSSQVLTNLGIFLKNEVIRLQALMTDLESKRQKAERQVQSNKDALEKLSQVEKQAQEVISESIKLQRENEAIFQENAKEKTVNEDAKNEPLSLQQIWR